MYTHDFTFSHILNVPGTWRMWVLKQVPKVFSLPPSPHGSVSIALFKVCRRFCSVLNRFLLGFHPDHPEFPLMELTTLPKARAQRSFQAPLGGIRKPYPQKEYSFRKL